MNTNTQAINIRRLALAGLCLALCMFLPFLTGQIPQIGSMLSPMHIPALLCGFACGPLYGLAVGAVAPLLRFALFGMPPIFPTGAAMAFELAAYGALTGLFYKLFPKKTLYVYAALAASMLLGRVVWGVVSAVLYGMAGREFTFAAFIAGGFVNAVPAIILHIAIVPVLVLALKKAKLM